MAVAKISCIYLKKHRFWNNGTCIYLKYAVLASKTSSWVKTDPPILTGSKKRSWSQNLKSLAQKTKIWHNYVFSRRFGKYSFQDKQTQKQMIRPKIVYEVGLLFHSPTVFTRFFMNFSPIVNH